MDEEETVDDVKTKEAEVEATQMSTAGKKVSDTSNDIEGQVNVKQPVETVSFFGNIKEDFFTLSLNRIVLNPAKKDKV
ncbi:hypothetical protein [Peribacillus sp. NPDC058075]|uniref:hypothetical protein n=1 Tax=unclassified Peribacillus TaxID=2675266 RepID=UPI0036DF8600